MKKPFGGAMLVAAMRIGPKKQKREDKMSALDAAAKVLADSGDPMTTKELIEKMTAKGLWPSPNGKAPDRTLISADRARE